MRQRKDQTQIQKYSHEADFYMTPTCCAKGVAARKCPHAGKNHRNAATKDGHAYYDISMGDSACLYVVQREDKRCGCEGE